MKYYRPIWWTTGTPYVCFFILLILFFITVDDRNTAQDENKDLKARLSYSQTLNNELSDKIEDMQLRIDGLEASYASSQSALEREKAAHRASRSRSLVSELRMAPTAQIEREKNTGGLNWEKLRECENSGRYNSRPGDRYRGAYQFDQQTWNATASRHDPSWYGRDPASAPELVQDRFAQWLYDERGSQPWPVCGKYL